MNKKIDVKKLMQELREKENNLGLVFIMTEDTLPIMAVIDCDRNNMQENKFLVCYEVAFITEWNMKDSYFRSDDAGWIKSVAVSVNHIKWVTFF